MIQLPKSKGSDDGHEFWKWLVSGSEYGFLQNFVSTSLTGEQCAKDSKIIFKRIGATHSIEYYKNNNVITPDDEGGYYFHLPGGRKKYIKEVKTMGINFRDTKMLRGEDHNVFHVCTNVNSICNMIASPLGMQCAHGWQWTNFVHRKDHSSEW